jgi:hypothetical protein
MNSTGLITQVRGSVAPRRLELELHLPRRVELYALVRERRPGDVAAKLFQPLALACFHPDRGVQTETIDVGAQGLPRNGLARRRARRRQARRAGAPSRRRRGARPARAPAPRGRATAPAAPGARPAAESVQADGARHRAAARASRRAARGRGAAAVRLARAGGGGGHRSASRTGLSAAARRRSQGDPAPPGASTPSGAGRARPALGRSMMQARRRFPGLAQRRGLGRRRRRRQVHAGAEQRGHRGDEKEVIRFHGRANVAGPRPPAVRQPPNFARRDLPRLTDARRTPAEHRPPVPLPPTSPPC